MARKVRKQTNPGYNYGQYRAPIAPGAVNVSYQFDPAFAGKDAGIVGAYFDPRDDSLHVHRDIDPRSLAHELGHLFAQRVLNTPAAQAQTERVLGLSGSWYGNQSNYAQMGRATPPSEVFADYYAAAMTRLNPAAGETWTNYVGIDPKKLRGFERYLSKVGQRAHLQDWHKGYLRNLTGGS